MSSPANRVLLALIVVLSFVPASLCQSGDSQEASTVRTAYKQLIDAENALDLNAVSQLVLDSADTLFVAKAPVGWKGYWGKEDVMRHFHDLYQHPFRIDPDYANEKVVFPASGIAETYVPVRITAVYGHFPTPTPFIMVLLWVNQKGAWKMATDIPIPIPPEANKPSPEK